MRVAAVLIQDEVEFPVQLGEAHRVEVLQRLGHVLVDLGGGLDRVRGDVRHRECGRVPFQPRQHLRGLRVGVRVERGDPGADLGHHLYPAFGLEPPDGFPPRYRADAGLPDELIDDHPVARAVHALDDALSQPRIRDVSLAGFPGHRFLA